VHRFSDPTPSEPTPLVSRRTASRVRVAADLLQADVVSALADAQRRSVQARRRRKRRGLYLALAQRSGDVACV